MHFVEKIKSVVRASCRYTKPALSDEIYLDFGIVDENKGILITVSRNIKALR